jgi:hypothetical protein
MLEIGVGTMLLLGMGVFVAGIVVALVLLVTLTKR